MATTKTIQPTGTTITIPAMTDRPDVSVFSTDVERITDAVNAENEALATKAVVKKGNIASGSSVTIQITRPAFVVVGRASVSGTSTTALVDGWADIVYLSNNSGLTVSCSNDNLTITNNASSYVNYLVFY